MSYKITITKLETVKVIEKEYEKVADSGNPRDKGAVYEYVPHEKEIEQQTVLLSQTVEEIDIKEVIKAINFLA